MAIISTINEEDASYRLAELELKEYDVLKQLETFKDENPIMFFNRPNPPQALLLSAWDDPVYKVFTFSGGNRIGKTTIGTIIAICTMIGMYPWSKRRILFRHNEPRKVRYIGQDWEKHIKAVVLPALIKWWPKSRPITTKKNNQGIEALWTDIETGSTLEIMSNKQESELHEGWHGDLIAYDEPPKRAIRVANARGLIDRQGRELFSMTLLKEGWIDREVIKAVNEDGTPDMTVFNVHGEIYENVGFGITMEGVDQFAKTLTEDEKDARLKGIPSYMAGLIYGYFSRQKHLVERFEVPLSWPVDIAIDVHPREKQAVLFVATAPTGIRYGIDEIWENGDGVAVADEIVRRVKRAGYRVANIIIDPLAKGDKNNIHTTYDKVADTLACYDLPLSTASKDKSSGILLVKNHIKGPNNEPSIFFFNDLVRTLFEIEGYMWDEETQKPKDKDDHMMENLYRIMLLETEYTSLDEEEDNDFEAQSNRGRNAITGY
jgi:hypothetical protein